MSDAIVKAEPGVAALWKNATDVAGAVREFALKRVISVGGKRYPPVEVWQAIANTYGCVASARDVEKIEGGFRAIGEVKRISDGAILATGEGFVGVDEKTWQARPEFARRAMAQTRAISRCCRAAFAFIMPMIDAGLMTTPAEEMDFVEAQPTNGTPPASKTEQVKAELKAKTAKLPIQEDILDAEVVTDGRKHEDIVAPFGKGKGKPISKVGNDDLVWLGGALLENANDPGKARWKEGNLAGSAAVAAELEYRRLHGIKF